MRVAVIHNPAAGGRTALFASVHAALAAAGCAISVIPTAAKGDAEAIAAGLRRDTFERIVVAGGDGTLNEVINGLTRHSDPPPLAILPLGTANVLATEIGLAINRWKVVRTVLNGPARLISLGVVNDRRFVLMAGVGLDAEVIAALNPALKYRLGRAAYAVETLRQFAAGRAGRFAIQAGGCHYDVESAVVANARHYGGHWIIAPDAGLERPDLTLCLFERAGRWAEFRYAAALMRGTLAAAKGFATALAARVTIEGRDGAPVQTDGDIVARLPAEFTVLPAALRLVFPAP